MIQPPRNALSGTLSLFLATCLCASASDARAAELDRGGKPVANTAFEEQATPTAAKLDISVNVVHVGDDGKRRAVSRLISGLKAEAPAIKLGDHIEVCFSSDQEGSATLWDYDADGSPTQLYPNEYAPAEHGRLGVAVNAGEQICVGKQNDKFQIEMFEPLGSSHIYLHWTSDDADQLSEEMFVDVGRALRRARSRGEKQPATRGAEAAQSSTAFYYTLVK